MLVLRSHYLSGFLDSERPKDDGPHYEASLRELVDDELDDAGDAKTGEALIAFAAELRAIAEYVEAKVAEAREARQEFDGQDEMK